MASKEHQELANIIKKVHVDLRIKARLDGAEKAWNDHLKQNDQLQVYASAMKKLATEHWNKKNLNSCSSCRIQWVIDKCCEYFKNGGLEENIEKEIRLHKRYFNIDPSYTDHIKYLSSVKNETKLFLLDVGSCFNPFKRCEYFITVPIDLVPATDDVMQCDFLEVDIVPNVDIQDIKSPCKFLPANKFDIVVFSLLLEYFPSSKQRWLCCKKAYDLLKCNGVLVILTPDSKHASANAKIIKNWRFALADIGFLLVFYEKMKHLHCLIYRKCIDVNVPKHWLSLKRNVNPVNVEDMICIPQDFHEYEVESDELKVNNEHSALDNQIIAGCFNELPDISCM